MRNKSISMAEISIPKDMILYLKWKEKISITRESLNNYLPNKLKHMGQ